MFPAGISKGDRRKAEIIESIVDIVSREGFEGLSFDRIGQSTGMAKSHVVYHFKSKPEMIRIAFQYTLNSAQQLVLKELEGSAPGLDRLLSHMHAHFTWLMERPSQVQYLLMVYGRCSYDKDLRELNQKARLLARERIEAILEEGIKLTPKRRKHTGILIHDLLTGAMLDLICLYGSPSKSQIIEKRDELVQSVKSLWRCL